MNFFVCLRDRQGKKILVTAPLDGTILEGVTRESVIALGKERLGPLGWEVREEKFTMQDLAEAAEEGRLLEAFGSGTAAVVSPVRDIHWRNRVIKCGLKEDEEAGGVATMMKGWIEGIQYGDEVGHEWNWRI